MPPGRRGGLNNPEGINQYGLHHHHEGTPGAHLTISELTTAVANASSREEAHALLRSGKPSQVEARHNFEPTRSTLNVKGDISKHPEVREGVEFVASISSGQRLIAYVSAKHDKKGKMRGSWESEKTELLLMSKRGDRFDPVSDNVAATVSHEFGHVLESKGSHGINTRAFQRERAATPEGKQALHEMHVVRDLKTWDRHIPGSGIITNYALYAYHDGSTEILSTGLEALFRDPVRFAKLAPEHFKVTMLALRKE